MIFAIGDIHGQRERLTNLLAKLPLEPEDRLVFVGDYIDRGPDSPGVIEDLIALQEARPSTVFLRGNHEQMMLESRACCDPMFSVSHDIPCDKEDLWKSNGAAQTVGNYRQRYGSGTWWDIIPWAHWRFLLDTRMEFRDGGYIFVHAGIVPPGCWWHEPQDPRLWIREPFLKWSDDLGGVVVFGHTPQLNGKPLLQPNKVGIDTGCAFGGPLTAVGLIDPYDPKSVRVIQA